MEEAVVSHPMMSHPTLYLMSHLTPHPTSHLTSQPASHPMSHPTSHQASQPTSHPTSHPTSDQGSSCVAMDPSRQSIKLPVVEMLQQLREKQLYCDLVFDVDGTRFFCHRAIVAAWSPFIHSILNMKHVVKEVVHVDYDNVGVFATFLDYMYSRDFDLGDVNVIEVLRLATSFQVESFRDMCEAVFQCNLNMGNIISTFQLAHKFRLSNLEEYSLKYLQTNLLAAVKEDEFLDLSAVALNTFLSSGIAVALKPEVKLFLIISWLGYDVKERERYFVMLLEHIQWSAVAEEFLRDISQMDSFFSTSESSLYLLLNILDSMALPLGPYVESFPELQKKYSHLLSQVLEDAVLETTSDVYTPVPIQLMPSVQAEMKLYKESPSEAKTGFERGQTCKSRFEQQEAVEVMQLESDAASKFIVYINFENGKEDVDEGVTVMDDESHDNVGCDNMGCDDMSYDNKPDFSPDPATPHKEEQSLTHENEQGVTHENEQGVTHENEQGVTHENEQGVTHENERGVTHENEQGVTHEKEQGVTQEKEQGMTQERGVTHEKERGVTHEKEQGVMRMECCNEELEKLVASPAGEWEEERGQQEKKKKKKKKNDGSPQRNCPKCSYEANDQQSLHSHIKELHDNWVPYSCMFCDFVCHCASEYFLHYKQHYRQGPPYACDYIGCDKFYDRLAAVVTHRESHYLDRRWMCHKCSSKFKRRIDLLCHLRRWHKPNSKKKKRKVSCAEVVSTVDCLQKLVPSLHREREKEIEEHEKKKKDDATQLTCPICTYEANDQQSLHSHIKELHDNWVPYSCMFCDFVCHCASEYFLHYKQHYRQGPPYACDYSGCDKVYDRLAAVVTHRESHYLDRRWMCHKCSSKFKRRIDLLCHLRRWHKPNSKKKKRKVSCAEVVGTVDCLQKLAPSLPREREKEIEEHEKKKKDDATQLTCPICTYEANDQQSLHSHIKELHDNWVPYSCMFCDFVCHCASEYFLHYKQHYHQGPPYACDYSGCDKVYDRLAAVVTHRESHYLDRRWMCHKCSSKFKRRLDLLRHLKRCHKKKEGDVLTVSTEDDLQKLVASSLASEREDEREEHEEKKKKKKDVKSQLSCPMCSYEAQNQQLQDSHIVQHHRDWVAYSCMFCDFVCHWSPEYFLHYKQHYRQGPPYACDYKGCDQTYDTLPGFVTHRERHAVERKWQCRKCPSRFKVRKDLLCHMWNSHKEQAEKERGASHMEEVNAADKLQTLVASLARERKAEQGDDDSSDANENRSRHVPRRGHKGCPLCSYIPPNSQLQDEHMKRCHEGGLPFKCMLCDVVCHYYKEYFSHCKQHYPGPPYRCDHEGCSLTYARISSLIKHRETHVVECHWQCGDCCAKFKTRCSLFAHMKKVHSSDRKFACDLCTRRFATQNSLDRHMPEHGGQGYVCDKCTYTTKYQSSYEQHYRIHTGERPLKCKVCQRGFRTKSLLSCHVVTHNTEKSFRCNVCSFTTHHRRRLTAHYRRHTGDAFYCHFPKCSYTSTIRTQLMAHMRAHLGIRRHVCPTCGKSFVEKKQLAKHKQLHSGSRPYKCKECGYNTARRKALESHILYNHGDTPRKINKRRKKLLKKSKPDLEQIPPSGNIWDHSYGELSGRSSEQNPHFVIVSDHSYSYGKMSVLQSLLKHTLPPTLLPEQQAEQQTEQQLQTEQRPQQQTEQRPQQQTEQRPQQQTEQRPKQQTEQRPKLQTEQRPQQQTEQQSERQQTDQQQQQQQQKPKLTTPRKRTIITLIKRRVAPAHASASTTAASTASASTTAASTTATATTATATVVHPESASR